MIESFRTSFVVIFIDHFDTTDIVNQIRLTIFSIEKFNLRLIRASQYLFILSIEIRIKSEKLHIVLNVLFRLLILFDKKKSEDILKNLNDDIEMHFVMTRQQRHTSALNARSHRIEVVLEAYLKKDKIIIEMNQNFKKNLKKKYAVDHT